MEPARGGDHDCPTVAVARRGDRDSSRAEPVRGWWRNNQDFMLRHQERTRGRAAARGDRSYPAVAVPRRGDRDSSRAEPVGGWWRNNQDFRRRHRERIRLAAAAAAAAGAEGAARRGEPASKKAMVALRVPAAGEVPEQDCAVCLEDFAAGGRKLRTMPCSHSFHQRCIFVWLLVNRRCPMCRFAMPSRADDEEDGDDDVERELVAE
ncbi:hypothetical protein QYE76_003586 [Lolium multiflorum]|uniref:RING-type domain-containing protein n=1 Tax=Lolium multiflorum TaxID=4521 RepID=A0AAD8RNZ9_LOLMU|nr:hypothetical protein QYE76_003586 [Lolium multiflorum]